MSKGLLSWSYQQGLKAQKKPPEKQTEIGRNVKSKLEVNQEKGVRRCHIQSSFLSKEHSENVAKRDALSEGQSSSVHRIIFFRSLFFLFFVALLFVGEFFLLNWTLQPVGKKLESLLIAASLTILGMLAVDKYLGKIKQVRPESYQKYVLYIVLISLVLLLVAGVLLSHTRGILLSSQNSGADLEEQVEAADRFYEQTKYLPIVMGSVALALSLIMGVFLHEALPKALRSGSVLRLEKKAKRTELKQVQIKSRLEGYRVLVKAGMAEYRVGLNDEIPRKKNLALSPFFILILAALLIILLATAVKGEESNHVFVLLDLSKSGMAKDFIGVSDFQKNYDAVGDIIKKVEPGTDLNVIGITENSFGKPYFILKGYLPPDEGAFGEKLAKAKISLIENWKKIEITPVANETDLFSCFSLVACLLDGKLGEKTLIIFSDMRNTVGFDLEKPDLINEAVIMKVEEAALIPNMKGVRIVVLGVSPNGKTMKYYESLEKFWVKYFDKAGAKLECYSMERDWKAIAKKEN